MASLEIGSKRIGAEDPGRTRAVESADALKGLFNPSLIIIGTLLIASISIGYRVYQQYFGWEYGTDASTPEFQTYWMTLFYVEIIVLAIFGVALSAYLWLTRDRALAEVTPREELKRYMTFLSMLFVYVISLYWAGSYFAEQDATWHQVVLRDTSFTASHIVVFYFGFPLFIALGFGSFLYATTRLPLYAKGVSIPLLIGVIGPFMVLPNVGLNEWGHAFWIMEEFFTVPLHYGFVFFGWAIVALGGILVQIMSRLPVLFAQVFGEEAEQA